MFTYHTDRIPNAGIIIDGKIPHDKMAFLLGRVLRPGKGPFPIRFEVSKRGSNILVDGEIELDYRFECGRCAETFDRSARIPLALTFMEGKEEPSDQDESETFDVTGLETDEIITAFGGTSGLDEREVVLFEGRTIDLEVPITEQLVLHLPPWPVCSDDCKGLCPNCGMNLNNESCTCATDVVDPRWAALKGLAATLGVESKRSQ